MHMTRGSFVYHGRLYANAPKANPEQLKAHVQKAGADMAAFLSAASTVGHTRRRCRKTSRSVLRRGDQYSGGFFINGQLLSGAHPLESFVRMIEEALARAW